MTASPCFDWIMVPGTLRARNRGGRIPAFFSFEIDHRFASIIRSLQFTIINIQIKELSFCSPPALESF
jgi:hypothetical protein